MPAPPRHGGGAARAGDGAVTGAVTTPAAYALVLAAGRARRFGGGKLLAPLGGRPVLAHALDVASRAMQRGLLAGVTCVAPDADGAIAALARDAGAEVVVNPEPDAGLSRSVQIGLDHLATIPAAGPAAALFLLGDQPAATVETLAALIATWRSGAGPVVRPRYLEEPDVPGHPLLLDRRAWALAALLRGDEGFAPLIRSRGLPVTVVDRPGRNPDIDTRTDLALLEERH